MSKRLTELELNNLKNWAEYREANSESARLTLRLLDEVHEKRKVVEIATSNFRVSPEGQFFYTCPACTGEFRSFDTCCCPLCGVKLKWV